jgi:hypothetical protein
MKRFPEIGSWSFEDAERGVPQRHANRFVILPAMPRALTLAVLAICVSVRSGATGRSNNDATLEQLYDQHRWFELRDTIAGGTVAPFYVGAVASAFNQVASAEAFLNRAVREARTPDDANKAREALAILYMQHSRSRDMLRILDDMLTAAPTRADVRNMRDGFERFRRIPNQVVHLGRRTPFVCAVTSSGVTLPARVNGKPVEWLFDSGFSHASVSEGEARTLGIPVHGVSMTAGDFSATTQTQTGVAERIVIGDSELRNVPVMIFPDSHPMWSDRPPGRRGILGLPVAVALGGIGWTKSGTCQLGADPTGRVAIADANMAFDGESPPVTRVRFEGRMLDFTLDTGAQDGTQLWQRFAADFPQVIARGSKSTTEVQQIGGRREEEIVAIPDLRLRVGGFDALLPRARVFLNREGTGMQYGNLGMDVFSQASEVTFDFRRMSIAFR